MEHNFIDIYPEREANTGYDASLKTIIRRRDGARIEVNESALLIWQLCDGTKSIEDIIDLVCNSYGLDRSEAIESIPPMLQQLHDQQCLFFEQRQPGFTAPPTPPYVNLFPLAGPLLEQLEEYRHGCELLFPAAIDADDNELSETKLARAIDSQQALSPDYLAFRDLTCDVIPALKPLLGSVAGHIHDLLPFNAAQLVNSGQALYGAGGSMGWHTNEDKPGLRIYCTWAEKANANYFRYRDPDSGEIVTLPEPQGWMVKSFYIPPRPRQLWHCLYAGSRRIGIGFAEFEFQRTDQIT